MFRSPERGISKVFGDKKKKERQTNSITITRSRWCVCGVNGHEALTPMKPQYESVKPYDRATVVEEERQWAAKTNKSECWDHMPS